MTRFGRSLAVAASMLVVLAASSPAHAQLSQYIAPIEPAILESHIDLQFQYSKFSTSLGPLGSSDVNVALLGAEAQIKLGRFEIGVNLPFLQHGYGENKTQFGDVMLGFKAQLFSIANRLAIALFLNSWLPTHSADYTRKYFQFQSGAVASVHLLGFDVGGGIQTRWTIIGNGAPDLGLLGFYGYGRVPILGLIAVQLAIEYWNSLHPSGDLNAFLVTPSVELSVAWFHVGIGARIAATDDAKLITLGRVAVIANAGIRW